MKFSLNKLVIAAALVAPALSMASAGGAGMIDGRHDFATRAMFLTYQTTAGTQGVVNSVGLCSYCHTPHNAVSTSLLWNRAPAKQSFTWDEATTTGGTNYATIAPAYKGSTVKCLSCHDGSVSVGDVAVYKESSHLGDASSLNTYKVGDLDAAPKVSKKVGASGSMAGSHPVGMPYPLGNASSTYNNVTTGVDVVKTEFVGTPTPSAPLANGVKLYKDTGTSIVAGTAAGATGMECNTCHDVHNKSTNEDVMLRAKLAGSTQADGYICLQCHIK
ncbi:MAG: hypothetical protein AUK51_16695 [Comamonadaceae bacterium CG2_30_59_20]|nr:MAG: hypothetical protein AUK51_16695 [Comamonadaceae bacterium CG2_30_59_20]